VWSGRGRSLAQISTDLHETLVQNRLAAALLGRSV
jgi:hypothetical protein